MRKVVLHSLIILFISPNINAQSKHFAGIFPAIEHSGKISNKFQYTLSCSSNIPLINIQHPDITRDPYFLKFYSDAGLTYFFNQNLSFGLSYAYERVNVFLSNYTNENRVYLQAVYKQVLKSVSLKYRLRFDNRFVYNRKTNTAPYTHRLRALVGINVPIQSKKNNLYFTGYEEAFFNTFKNASSVYGENKFYSAIGMKLNNINKIELGGLYQTVKLNKINWFNQYYLAISWISQLDFTRKNGAK